MSAERAKAYLVHHAPGRVRFRVPERQHDAAFFAEIEARLGTCSHVQAAQTNPLTSGVLVLYTGSLDVLMAQVAASGLPALLDLEMSPPPLQPLTDRLREQASSLNEAVKRYTGGETDARSLALLALLAGGVIQLARRQFLGPAVPLLWYASQLAAAAASLPAEPQRPAASTRGARAKRSDQSGKQR
jgi:hypothetical protein